MLSPEPLVLKLQTVGSVGAPFPAGSYVSCFYDPVRTKPGFKRGTIDKLVRRIEVLEHAVSHQRDGGSSSPRLAAASATHDPVVTNTDLEGLGTANFSALAMQIQNLTSSISFLSQSIVPGSGSPGSQLDASRNNDKHRCKRQRSGSEETQQPRHKKPSCEASEELELSSHFLTGTHLEDLLDAYFMNIHPWIPMIHMTTFRRKIQGLDEAADPPLILHAMLAAALRPMNAASGDRISAGRIEREVERSRNIVITRATNSLTVEDLQALIIVAFMHIGNGEPLRAWPIVALLTRTVEYLQLSVEEGDADVPEAFLRPKPLPPPSDWMEQEELANICRICFVLTGWNIGLTADNVSRRLPICGTHWNRDNPALSPYFGVWDKSAAKISNSVAFLPAHYESPGQSAGTSGADFEITPPGAQKLQSPTAHIDTSAIGAFAYYVESLESLCRINMYFLNQKIDFSNRQDVSSWLTRFKELDLRLVHWRTILPAKWKDPEVPPPEATAALDPNMTLAHITHNTSMILLHQRIGYPEPQLKGIKLPNFNSAKTCQSAAIETANIAMKYLAHAPETMPLSPHFSFCSYVSARVLLVHCQYYGLALDPKFSILVKCLQEASRRWLFSQERSSTPSLSVQLADHLQFLHKRCLDDPTFYLRVVGSVESDVSRVTGGQLGDDMQRSQNRCEANHPSEQFLSAVATAEFATALQLGQPSTSISVEMPLGAPGRNILSDENPQHWTPSSDVPESRGSKSSTEPQDELSNILQTLTDQSYAVMDRVISLDDFNFDAASYDLAQMPTVPASSDWAPEIYGYVAREHHW
ncbi:hypothetical protein VE04_01606 [Pseudogymnoascus sp. 24MN13]|nr:hypothetical protein VE04_01606 [Pseudogymnoascus sp. 24MN13]